MIVTEEEAKKLYCVDWMSSPVEATSCECVASKCMAWKWVSADRGERECWEGCCGKIYPNK